MGLSLLVIKGVPELRFLMLCAGMAGAEGSREMVAGCVEAVSEVQGATASQTLPHCSSDSRACSCWSGFKDIPKITDSREGVAMPFCLWPSVHLPDSVLLRVACRCLRRQSA